MPYQESSKSPGLLRRIFSGIGRIITWLRVTLANVIFLGLIVIVILALSPRPIAPLPDDFALRLSPSGYLVDETTYVAPLELLLGGAEIEQAETRVRDLVSAIDGAAQDPRVTGLVLELDDLLGGGVSKLEEVGTALERFKKSNKPLFAVGAMFNQDQYYLASYADEIFLHDMGMVLITGYESYRYYFREALDKLAINVHVFRAGQYKDFIEPFTRNNMSQESREHISEWLNQLWGVYTSRVEQLRALPSGALNDYINNMHRQLQEFQGNSGQLALESGLVDHLMSHREIEQALVEQFGPNLYDNQYRSVRHDIYLSDLAQRVKPAPVKIGLLVASGTITEGQQPDGTIGSDTFIQQLQQVREDPDIRALVVRIDSGGGSAFASELIRTEIAALRDEGIPVLISMGSVAASGGYWIAAGGDEIWATPTTLTGSIGVFGAFPTFEDSLQKLGINTDGLGTTDLAGAARLDRPLTPQAQSLVQQSVDHIYNRFVMLVAEARGMDPAEVDRLAQGRVWTGATAMELGLVDQLGGLEQVIAAAAERADVYDYDVELITRPLTTFEVLLRQFSTSHASSLMPEGLVSRWASGDLERRLSPLLQPIKALDQMNDRRGIYARCVECAAP